MDPTQPDPQQLLNLMMRNSRLGGPFGAMATNIAMQGRAQPSPSQAWQPLSLLRPQGGVNLDEAFRNSLGALGGNQAQPLVPPAPDAGPVPPNGPVTPPASGIPGPPKPGRMLNTQQPERPFMPGEQPQLSPLSEALGGVRYSDSWIHGSPVEDMKGQWQSMRLQDANLSTNPQYASSVYQNLGNQYAAMAKDDTERQNAILQAINAQNANQRQGWEAANNLAFQGQNAVAGHSLERSKLALERLLGEGKQSLGQQQMLTDRAKALGGLTLGQQSNMNEFQKNLWQYGGGRQEGEDYTHTKIEWMRTHPGEPLSNFDDQWRASGRRVPPVFGAQGGFGGSDPSGGLRPPDPNNPNALPQGWQRTPDRDKTGQIKDSTGVVFDPKSGINPDTEFADMVDHPGPYMRERLRELMKSPSGQKFVETNWPRIRSQLEKKFGATELHNYIWGNFAMKNMTFGNSRGPLDTVLWPLAGLGRMAGYGFKQGQKVDEARESMQRLDLEHLPPEHKLIQAKIGWAEHSLFDEANRRYQAARIEQDLQEARQRAAQRGIGVQKGAKKIGVKKHIVGLAGDINRPFVDDPNSPY